MLLSKPTQKQHWVISTGIRYQNSGRLLTGAPEYGVDDGDRTRDNKNHNLALYQLSYAHHKMARPAGFEPATLGLAYQLRLSTPQPGVCGLDYLFTISGVARIVSTEPSENRLPT